MILEIVVVERLVDEARESGPVVFGQGCGEGDVESEVGELTLDLTEVLFVEDLGAGACSVPVGHFATRLHGIEEVKELGTKGSHTCATADVDHFGVRFVDMEVTVGSAHLDLVAGLEVKDVRGGDTRRNLHPAAVFTVERRSGDADVEGDDVAFRGVIGHRVGACRLFVVLGHKRPHTKLVPLFLELVVHVERGVGDFILGNRDLRVGAGLEVHTLALGELDGELFDEGSNVVVGDDLALPFFHAEYFVRDVNLHILFHFHLAGEAPVILELLAREVGQFGGDGCSAAFEDLATALSAGSLSSAGGGKEDALILERIQECAAHRNAHIPLVIDEEVDVARSDQLVFGDEEQHHQNQNDDEEDCRAHQKEKCCTHILLWYDLFSFRGKG